MPRRYPRRVSPMPRMAGEAAVASTEEGQAVASTPEEAMVSTPEEPVLSMAAGSPGEFTAPTAFTAAGFTPASFTPADPPAEAFTPGHRRARIRTDFISVTREKTRAATRSCCVAASG